MYISKPRRRVKTSPLKYCKNNYCLDCMFLVCSHLETCVTLFWLDHGLSRKQFNFLEKQQQQQQQHSSMDNSYPWLKKQVSWTGTVPGQFIVSHAMTCNSWRARHIHFVFWAPILAPLPLFTQRGVMCTSRKNSLRVPSEQQRSLGVTIVNRYTTPEGSYTKPQTLLLKKGALSACPDTQHLVF